MSIVRYAPFALAAALTLVPSAIAAQAPPEPLINKGTAPTVPPLTHDTLPSNSTAAGARMGGSNGFTFTVPVQLTTIGKGTSRTPNEVTVDCGVVSGTEARFVATAGSATSGGSRVEFQSSPTSTGSAGVLVARGSARVRLDSTGSYSGPPITVATTLEPNVKASEGHAWKCLLLFDGVRPQNTRSGNAGSATSGGGRLSDYPYVESTFHVEAAGTIH